MGTSLVLFTLAAIAQSTPPTIHGERNTAPIRAVDLLQTKGIDSSHASLAAALHNSDPEIRIEAAAVLAEKNDPEATSLIESALASESNPKAMVLLASTLMSLDDPAGARRLTEICTDPSLPDQTVADAAFSLVFRGSGAQCIDELTKRLRDPNKVDSGMYMIIQTLGPLSKRASPVQQTEILSVLQNHLSDKEPTIRLFASHALAQTGFPNSAEIIKTALQQEAELMVRAGMESDLAMLTQKH